MIFPVVVGRWAISQQTAAELVYRRAHAQQWMFFDNPPTKKDFHKALNAIFENIKKVKKTPLKDRTYDEE